MEGEGGGGGGGVTTLQYSQAELAVQFRNAPLSNRQLGMCIGRGSCSNMVRKGTAQKVARSFLCLVLVSRLSWLSVHTHTISNCQLGRHMQGDGDVVTR